jgi:hypothetical protein
MATLREAFNNEDDQRPIVIFLTDGGDLGLLRNSPFRYRELPNWVLNKNGLPSKEELERARKAYEKVRPHFSLDDIYRAAEKARATIYTVVPERQKLGRPLDEVIAELRAERQNYLDRFFPNKFDRRFPMPGRNTPKWFEFNMSDAELKASAEDAITMQTALASVATSTGGWTMFLERPSDADRVFSNILSDINLRYIVGYYPTNKERDGKRRRINITVRDHPDYVVVGRRWYYADGPDQ